MTTTSIGPKRTMSTNITKASTMVKVTQAMATIMTTTARHSTIMTQRQSRPRRRRAGAMLTTRTAVVAIAAMGAEAAALDVVQMITITIVIAAAECCQMYRGGNTWASPRILLLHVGANDTNRSAGLSCAGLLK